MPISIIRFHHEGNARWGRLMSPAPSTPDQSVQIALLAHQPDTTAGLLAEYDAHGDLATTGNTLTIAAAQLLSPITRDATLVCQGLNYADHAEESGHTERKANLLFAKASSTLNGPYDDIVRPDGVELLDYEAEIGIVLRKAITQDVVIDPEHVGDFVGAVVLANDVSARDVMFGAGFLQWFQGKSFRGFCPTGPVLYVLASHEAAIVLDNLSLSLEYRGKVRQSANSAQQIYKAPATLTQIAGIMDMKPGDLVLTGTPGGVLAQGTPTLGRMLATHLFNDALRREEMVAESKKADPFLQPGDTLSLFLRDEANGIDLGGQFTRITAG